MYPAVAVVSVERHCVVHELHDGEISQLHALGVAQQESEAVYGGIVSDTLDGDVELSRLVVLYL